MWHHWVDSRVVDAAGTNDEGLMTNYEGENSYGEELELETGNMLNPITGQKQDYEEVWANIPQEAAGHESQICVVLIAESTSKREPTGMVVRVGQYCQGVLRIGDKFVVERWQWVARVQTWKRVVRIGDGELPCALACNSGPELTLGAQYQSDKGDFHWKVEELIRG